MEKAPAELMKEYVNSQKFTSTTEIMEAMKTMFGDVLQQVMEAELDTKLGVYSDLIFRPAGFCIIAVREIYFS